jgi:hypothetical protein
LRFGAGGRALNFRRGAGVEPATYVGAIGLLVRNPTILLAPFAASLVQSVLMLMAGTMAGGGGLIGTMNASLTQLIAQLLNSVGLAIAIIAGDLAWRRGRASFDEIASDARRKLPDILMAALGFNFIVWVATYAGSFILGGIGGLILGAVALFFFIYTMPAAAIGGIPGGAALQVSLERARSNVAPTLVIYAIYVVTFYVLIGIATSYLFYGLISLGVPSSNMVTALAFAVVQAILSGYVALVLAKTYAEISYGRRYY